MNELSTDTRRRSNPSPKKIRHVRVQDEVWIPAAQKAEAEGITISELVRDLLRDYLRE